MQEPEAMYRSRRQARLRRRPSRHGRLGASSAGWQREDCEVLTAGRERGRPARPGRGRAPGWRRTARRRVPRRRQGRRHPRQRHLSGRLSLRQPDDRGEHHRRRRIRPASSKLLFLGSSCIYPKFAPQPIPEDALLTGPLEPTNEWYAIAKIAGIKLCQAYRRQHGCDYISAMPTNLYGPGDNFDLTSSHVHAGADPQGARGEAAGRSRASTIWGTGTPRREFLHVDDLRRCLRPSDEDLFRRRATSMSAPARTSPSSNWPQLVCDAVGFSGEIVHDLTKPDGTPRKLMDVEQLRAMGWQASTPLQSGLDAVYGWFLDKIARNEIRGF